MPRGHPKELRFEQIPPRWIGKFVQHIVVGDGCWEWGGSRNNTGYGSVGITGYGSSSAHRVAFVIFHRQTAPYGIDIAHSCDNPGCVNPSHLTLCTRGQNVADSMNKGRWFIGVGDDHSSTKIPDAAIDLMREMRAEGYAIATIAARFGCHPTHAARIVNGVRRTSKATGRIPMKHVRQHSADRHE